MKKFSRGKLPKDKPNWLAIQLREQREKARQESSKGLSTNTDPFEGIGIELTQEDFLRSIGVDPASLQPGEKASIQIINHPKFRK